MSPNSSNTLIDTRGGSDLMARLEEPEAPDYLLPDVEAIKALHDLLSQETPRRFVLQPDQLILAVMNLGQTDTALNSLLGIACCCNGGSSDQAQIAREVLTEGNISEIVRNPNYWKFEMRRMLAEKLSPKIGAIHGSIAAIVDLHGSSTSSVGETSGETVTRYGERSHSSGTRRADSSYSFRDTSMGGYGIERESEVSDGGTSLDGQSNATVTRASHGLSKTSGAKDFMNPETAQRIEDQVLASIGEGNDFECLFGYIDGLYYFLEELRGRMKVLKKAGEVIASNTNPDILASVVANTIKSHFLRAFTPIDGDDRLLQNSPSLPHRFSPKKDRGEKYTLESIQL